MTPKRAIEIVDQAISQVTANRETHSVLIEAVSILRSLIPTEPTPANQETQK